MKYNCFRAPVFCFRIPFIFWSIVIAFCACWLFVPSGSFNKAFGVLAVNTTQAAYVPGEMVEIHAGLVDLEGQTICGAALSVRIKREVPLPVLAFSRKGVMDWLTAFQKRISERTVSVASAPSLTCRDNTPVEPDYRARVPVLTPGRYNYEVVARSWQGVFFARNHFLVVKEPAVDIRRRADTRIYPNGYQDMAIDLTARTAFKGVVTERVPDAFEVHPPREGQRFAGFIRDRKRGEKRIFWRLDLKPGERCVLGYRYDVTAVSPRYYETGPLTLSDRNNSSFRHEARAWQIVTDVAAGVIVAWPSTNASIPAGWSRETAFDTYHLQGTTANPSAVAGGNATHTHTSPAHQHTLGGHTHNGSTGASAGTTVVDGVVLNAVAPGHTHTITTAGNTDNNVAQSANLGTASNDPPYTEVILIKSNGSTDIPNGAWAFFNSDTLPVNWTRQSGNRFLKGAAAGGNGGGTGGTSDSHTHTDSGHTHTENSHTHTGTTDAGPAGTLDSRGGAADTATGGHTHTISGGGVVATETAGTATLANGDGQPPFTKLNIIQNGTGAAALPNNIIAMWDGTIATIPPNWKLCDGAAAPSCPNMNTRFVKGANANGETGTTGGAATHTHPGTGAAHTHTINSHTHAFTVDVTSGGTRQKGAGLTAASLAHTHTLSLNGGGTTGTAQISADANSDNRPPYKEIVYIQYAPTAPTTRWYLISMLDGIVRGGGTIARGVVALVALVRVAVHQQAWLLVVLLFCPMFQPLRKLARNRVERE